MKKLPITQFLRPPVTSPFGGSCKHRSKPYGSIKCWEFLEWLSNCWLFSKDYAPCVGWSPYWVRSGRRPLLAYYTCPSDCDDGEFGGMKIGRGNRSTRRTPAPAPLYPPQIQLDQTRARTPAAAVGCQTSFSVSDVICTTSRPLFNSDAVYT
jgi:hypothetical protein